MIKRTLAVSAVILAIASAANAGPSEAMAFAIGQCSAQTDPQARLACYDQIAAKLKAGEPVGPQSSAPFWTPPAAGGAQAPTPPSAAMAPSVAGVPAPPPTAEQQAQTFGQPQPTKKDTAWYNPGSWFGSDDGTPRATSGSPAEFGAEALPKTRAAGEPEPLDEISANVANVAFNDRGRFTVSLDNGQIWKQIDGDTGVAKFNRKGGDRVTISRGMLGSYNLVVAGRTAMFKVRRIQ